MRTEIRPHESTSVRNRERPLKVVDVMSRTIEAVERSPKGYPYPVRIREISANGTRQRVFNFSVDFEADIPDELFEPLK